MSPASTIISLFFLTFFGFARVSISQDTSEWIRIDCGSDKGYQSEDGTLWLKDDDFIQTGTNQQLPNSSNSLSPTLNTLRVFIEQNKNCYTLPVTKGKRYFIKAGFHYGNYDGLSNPPTFKLNFDGIEWTNVSNLAEGPQFYELIYTSTGANISVCLARSKWDSMYPFISSLELWPLADGMYAGMRTDVGWISQYRYMYGATDRIFGYPQDSYNRAWKPMDPPLGLKLLTANFSSILNTSSEHPPDTALLHAVEASPSSPYFSLPLGIFGYHIVYYVLHFTETRPLSNNEMRSVDVLIGGLPIATVIPQYQKCITVSYEYEVSDIMLETTLDELKTSLPPTVSAVEIYISTRPFHGIRTSQDDLDGLQAIVDSFKQLQGWMWSGDPCQPSETPWQWVACDDWTGRVISINLSNYDLAGHFPDFRQMQALEGIDMGNNHLHGSIPDFLGKLPKLKSLILRNNRFKGSIPKSIVKNKLLVYDFAGNDVHKPLVLPSYFGILIVVGASLVVLTVVFMVWMIKKKRNT